MSPRGVAFAPGRGGWIVVVLACALAIGVALALYFSNGAPARGYTGIGLVAAAVAVVAMALAGAYSWRKRAGQEHTRGQLSAWLAWHLVLSAIALAGAWLHSGAHFNGGSGTVAALLLLLALGSGVFGLLRYLRVPEQVLADVGNLAPGTLELEIRRLQQQRDLILSGAASVDVARETAALDAEIASRRGRLARQASYHGKLRGWLWVHVPASIGLALMIVWHVAATWDTIFPPRTTSPLVFESAQDCRGCHSKQFDEWSGSMHAMAFQSPLTDIQNRLVLSLEDRQVNNGEIDRRVVGDLCVRCHAPLGFLPDPKAAQESIRARVSDPHRDTTLEGITCSACHRMPESHRCDSPEQKAGLTFRRCEGGGGVQDRQFYNANNLDFTAGPAFYGPYGGPGDRAAVGNSYHRGLLSGHADSSLEQRSAICASCHTVEVHDPADGSKVLVRLQDTYDEWLQSGRGKGSIPWHEQFACTDCHNAEYPKTLEKIQGWQDTRTCLRDRKNGIQLEMAREFAAMPMRASADPVNGIDRSLLPRTKLNHAFVGVDIHLEPEHLQDDDYPAFKGKVDVPVQGAIDNTDRLLHQAAAMRIVKVENGRLLVDVANLATGHTLPAGFAFARELWVEVAVSRSDDGDDFEVVIGGNNGRPIANGERLNKRQPGLKNFQAVLFSRKFKSEVVLQNQADTVLTGALANDAGFKDRVAPIEPGDVANLSIDLGSQVDLSDVRRVRVRLRFRSLPPEFLDRMSKIADARGLGPDGDRLREMVKHLHVFDVAQDESTLDGGLKCPP